MFAEIAGQGILLTGDAGIGALSNALDYAPIIEIDLGKLATIQIPHHGSRNNVSPTLLDRLIGPRIYMGGTRGISAIVSASSKSETHPRRIVTNAFKRRGCKVFQTKGNTHCNQLNMATRPGWFAAAELPFHAEVEPYDS